MELEDTNKLYALINRRIAVLQLCTDRECLVFQIKHAPFVPRSLIAFLANEDHTFFGVGIRENVEILRRDYFLRRLRVPNMFELRSLATDKFGESSWMQAELHTLARRVLYKEVSKPQSVTNCNWGDRDLSKEQVQYACVNAFVSFKIGQRLYRGSS